MADMDQPLTRLVVSDGPSDHGGMLPLGRNWMAGMQERDYHMQRAQAELDCAYRAEHRVAAQAHMRLSALHMKRMRQVKESEAAI